MKAFTKALSALLAIAMLVSCFVIIGAQDSISYSDVPDTRWSYPDIMYVSEKGYMNGTGDNEFNPTGNMTRAMVVTVLFRLSGADAPKYSSRFSDVAEGKWYTDAVIWAANVKVVNGKTATTFAPNDNVTREQLAAMMMRYAEAIEYVNPSKKADITVYEDYSEVHDYALDALAWANAAELITGVSKTELRPRGNATREQFASILHRFETAEFDYNLVYNDPVPLSQYTEKEYPLVEDADLYVSPNGDDTNDGKTTKTPIRTFEKAVELVRELKKTATEEIKVAFMAGEYGVLDNLHLTAADSGTAEVPITYCAYGDGEVTFTNGLSVKEGDFTELDESDKALFTEENVGMIKKAQLPDYVTEEMIASGLSLFNDDGPVTVARVPNKGITDNYYTNSVFLIPREGYTKEQLVGYINDVNTIYDLLPEDKITKEIDDLYYYLENFFVEQKSIQVKRNAKRALDSYRTLEDVRICGYISKVWSFDVMDIESYDSENGIIHFTEKPSYNLAQIDDKYQIIYIENASEELDVKGEYWVDKYTKTLYVYDPSGEYTAATADTFMTIDHDAEYITLRGLNFQCCNGIGMYANGNNFTMDLCSISRVGGSYALLSKNALNVKITNSTFAYCAETAVSVEAPHPGRFPEHHDDYYMLKNTGFVFENNLIHDVDLFAVPTESGGLSFSWQVGANVSHNEIYNSARYGIDFKYGNIDCVMEYNYVHDCMQNSADGGAFYCGRTAVHRGNVIRHNIISNIVPLNSVHTGGTFAIYLDDGNEGVDIYGNIFYNASNIMNNKGRAINVCDNVFIGNGGFTSWDASFELASSYAALIDTKTYYNEGWNSIYSVPDKDSEAGKIWMEKWPELYDIHAIMADPDCYKDTKLNTTPVLIVTGNRLFDGATIDIGSSTKELSKLDDNKSYTTDENPFFVDPTHGNYSIVDGADCFDIHFEQIGRY